MDHFDERIDSKRQVNLLKKTIRQLLENPRSLKVRIEAERALRTEFIYGQPYERKRMIAD